MALDGAGYDQRFPGDSLVERPAGYDQRFPEDSLVGHPAGSLTAPDAASLSSTGRAITLAAARVPAQSLNQRSSLRSPTANTYCQSVAMKYESYGCTL